MKIIIILLISLATSPFLSGQALKKIKVKNESPWTKEVYYVLKSNNEIKHGKYEKSLRGSLLCSGEYLDGIKAGIWNYYGSNGQISQKVDFTKYELIESNDNQKGVFSFVGESHEVVLSNDSSAKTENSIFNPILYFIIF